MTLIDNLFNEVDVLKSEDLRCTIVNFKFEISDLKKSVKFRKIVDIESNVILLTRVKIEERNKWN